MLDWFNRLPSSVQGFIGLIFAGLIFAGLLNIDDLPVFNQTTEDNSLVPVQVLVQTEENQPIPDAKIQFISQGSPSTKYTTGSGYAEIEIPARGSVEVNISKEGYDTLVEIINLATDPNTNKKFKLKSTNVSIQDINYDYQHYTARHEFFPLVLSSLDPELKIPIVDRIFKHINIEKIPQVAQNSVFKTIQKFKAESGNNKTIEKLTSNNPSFAVGNTDQTDSTSWFMNQDNEIREIKRSYRFSSQLGENPQCDFGYAPILGSLQTTADNAVYTSIIQREYDRKDGFGQIIQYPKLSALAQYGEKDYGDLECVENLRDFWIRKIVENNPDIRGFLGLDYSFIFNPETDPINCNNVWKLTRISPSPYVKFIDFINNSQEPIRIESITYQSVENNPYKLTVADQRSQLFQSSSNVTERLNISIRPENHLLIPIEFGFNTEPAKESYQFTPNIDKGVLLDAKEIYVRKALSSSEWELVQQAKPEQKNRINMMPINLSEDFVNETNSSEELFNLIHRRFAVGTILNVQSLKINGQDINIDPPSDEPPVYVSTLLLAGSCPYLTVYDPKQDAWLELGTILYARKDKSLQHEEIHTIGNSISKMKIEEREPEITYIDALSIVYTEPETKEVQEVIYPMAQLQKVDEDYLILHQGESLEINLEDFIPANALDVKLKVNGYYEILQGDLS